MGEFRGVVLTEKGLALEAKMRVGKVKMEFTKAATGDGDHAESEDIVSLTELKSKRQEFGISTLSIVNDVTVFLRFIVTNKQEQKELKEGYYITEVGIYAEDPDDGEILYAVAIAENGKADYMPAYNNLMPSTITMDFYTEVANSSNVTIKVSHGAYVASEDFEEHKKDTNVHVNSDEKVRWNSSLQDAKNYADNTYQQSTGYTDKKIAELINGAPSTLDTLGEIAEAMKEHKDVVKALEQAIGNKANKDEMESLLGTKLDKGGDSKDNTVTFSSGDASNPTEWTEVELLASGEKHNSIFAKISTMIKNVRFLWKQITELNGNLSVDGKSFIYDYQDGQPGWNESPDRGADTFHPFSDDSACIILPQKYKIRTQMGARIFYPTALSDVFYNMSVCAYPLGTVKKFKINIDLQGIEGSFRILWYGNDGNIIHEQSYTVKNQHIEVSTDDYEDTVAIGLSVENSTFTTNVEVFPITN